MCSCVHARVCVCICVHAVHVCVCMHARVCASAYLWDPRCGCSEPRARAPCSPKTLHPGRPPSPNLVLSVLILSALGGCGFKPYLLGAALPRIIHLEILIVTFQNSQLNFSNKAERSSKQEQEQSTRLPQRRQKPPWPLCRRAWPGSPVSARRPGLCSWGEDGPGREGVCPGPPSQPLPRPGCEPSRLGRQKWQSLPAGRQGSGSE